MLGIILWQRVNWHSAAWTYSRNLLQPLIQSDHIKSANWECSGLYPRPFPWQLPRTKPVNPEQTTVAISLQSPLLFVKLLFQSFLTGHIFKISLHNHCSALSAPLTCIKPTCEASARAWPMLGGAVFLCLEGQVLIMEPTIAPVFFAATRCC